MYLCIVKLKEIHSMIDFTNFNSLIEIVEYFNSEDICKQAIAEQRWADGTELVPCIR